MPAAQNRAALERAVANFNNMAHRERYLDLYDAKLAFYGVGPGPMDLEGTGQFYRGLWAAFPDGQLTIDDVVTEGEKLACRFAFPATHRGDFLGIPPTGKRITLAGNTILRFANGKCVERWNNADMLGLLQQLGAVPTPGRPAA